MKKAFKNLRAAFAAATLGLVATPALAQDAAPATPAPVTAPAAPTVVFNTPEAIAPITSTARPDLSNWFARDYMLGDSRMSLYNCADGTQNCWTTEERQANDVGEFRGMMMATTFACRQRPGNQNLMDTYDSFVVRHSAVLTASYRSVENRFIALAATPRAGSRAHDTLDTHVANIFSGAATNDGYCETASQILRHAASLETADELKALASEVMAGSRRPAATPPAPPAV